MRLDPTRYEQLRASGRLPSPQGMALAIIQLLRHDDYRIEDLIRLVQSDPAIAGRILRFANTAALAAFAQGRPIVALSKAVLALGAFRVRDIVLAFSVLNSYRQGKCAAFDYDQFWSRSLAMAIAAQTLAPHAQMAPDESFTVGLLCDIGELALAALFPERYSDIIVAAAGDAEAMIAAETEAFDLDHRRLGASLLTEWGLPEVLVAAAYHSRSPNHSELPEEGSRHHTLALSLQLARGMADICVASDARRWSLVPPLLATAARLGIEPVEIEQTADRIVASWREWGQTLKIHTRELPAFAQVMSESPAFLEQPAPPPALADPGRRRALLIVSRQTLADDLERLLGAEGYAVETCASGLDGLMRALREPPSLVMIDIDAAELPGPGYCQSLRAIESLRDAHIAVVGDARRQTEAMAYLNAGADDFLACPVSAAAVRGWLKSMLRISALQGEIRRERKGVVRSAGEWAESRQRLIRLAHTDPLTKLPNRRYGLDFLATELALAVAGNSPLACLMVDIDHFKAINDEHGHETGDTVLADVATRVQAVCRQADLAFRLGGEEFCVVCPGSDTNAARSIAERLRQSIAADAFGTTDRPISLTVSIGVAIRAPTHNRADDLLRDADIALYSAKQGGRNRVVVA